MSASAGLLPLPPSITHTTTRLTHKQAHTLLSSFLDQAENDAAYRPDSTLTERGPQALSSGSTPNLTLAHLKRILLGMEGKRVRGGIKVVGEEDGAQEAESAEKGDDEVDLNEENREEDVELETSLRKPPKKSKKRAMDADDHAEENGQTPKAKKQRQAQKIISTSNAEQPDDPTGGAVLGATSAVPPSNQEQEGSEDWQDSALYALGQYEVNTNDGAHTPAQVENGERGQNESEDFNDFDGNNEVEEARNPSANLKQPRSKKEEKALVSIKLSGTGETVDPRDTAHDREGAKSRKKDRKSKEKKAVLTDETEPVPHSPSPNVEKSPKKQKKQKNEDKDQDQHGNLNMGMLSSPPVRNIQVSKKAEDEEATSQALSKDERKKLKKMRQSTVKKDREEVRSKKKWDKK